MKKIKVYVYESMIGGAIYEHTEKQDAVGCKYLGTRTIELNEPEEKPVRRRINIENNTCRGMPKFYNGESVELVEIKDSEKVLSEDDVSRAIEVYVNFHDHDRIIETLFKKDGV